jgi:hypothetical protein
MVATGTPLLTSPILSEIADSSSYLPICGGAWKMCAYVSYRIYQA